MDMEEISRRLNLLEFRQQLLMEAVELSNFKELLFEANVGQQQYDQIEELFGSLEDRLNNNEEIERKSYENNILNIASENNNFHDFAEKVALAFYKQGKYEKVFEALYGDSIKYENI